MGYSERERFFISRIHRSARPSGHDTRAILRKATRRPCKDRVVAERGGLQRKTPMNLLTRNKDVKAKEGGLL